MHATTPKNNPGKPAARVLIVDDHPAVREALGIRIAGEPDLEVCGEAADPIEAIRVATATNPDVAVIDLALRAGSGIDLIKRLKAEHEKLRLIVWSMYSEDLYAERALRAGARGYINKEQATSEIIEAIRRVLDGKIYLSAAMTGKLLDRHVGPAARSRASGTTAIDLLSNRELDVFRMIGQGVKTVEIAARLHLSVKTIETYRERIRHKLDLGDGAELARSAVQWVLENG
jgi:DNA-binding NarL/FixJ family response regulator